MNSVDLIGYNIKRVLKEKKRTMRSVEEETGMSYGMICKYTNGVNYPTCYTICTLADCLNVDVREFFKPINEPSGLELVKLFSGMSPSMKKAVTEIMKVSQVNGEQQE